MYNLYDKIASFYDPLSLALGKSYRKSKSVFLKELDKGDKVLYIGGGTGGNLPEILDRIGESGEIFYIEVSAEMTRKARKRIPSALKSRIIFLHQPEFSAIPLGTFDVVLTQYFLDILPDNDIDKLFQEINRRTDKNSRWIFVDFFEVKGKRWILNLMIEFFRIFTRNARKDLPDYGYYFARYGWKVYNRKSLDKGFLETWLLRWD